MTRAVTLRRALAASGLDALDAQVLLAHALGRDRAWLAARADELLAESVAAAFAALVARRLSGEPVAYLTGTREFWGLPFLVSPVVLVPRPETETLVELALERLPDDHTPQVLDLGTGSGAVALALAHERPKASIVATDVSEAALAIARENARRLSLGNVEFVQSDWYEGLSAVASGTRFDLIVSNPPYVATGDPHLAQGDLRFEPPAALSPGAEGLEAIRRIVGGAGAWLVAGGSLAFEHGYDQAARVRALLESAGWRDIEVRRDLAGIERVSAARRPG